MDPPNPDATGDPPQHLWAKFYKFFKRVHPCSGDAIAEGPPDPVQQKLRHFHRKFKRVMYVLKFFEALHSLLFGYFIFPFPTRFPVWDSVVGAVCLIQLSLLLTAFGVPRQCFILVQIAENREKKKYENVVFDLLLTRVILFLLMLVLMHILFYFSHTSVDPIPLVNCIFLSSCYYIISIFVLIKMQKQVRSLFRKIGGSVNNNMQGVPLEHLRPPCPFTPPPSYSSQIESSEIHRF